MDLDRLWDGAIDLLVEHQLLGIELWRWGASLFVFVAIYLARRLIISWVMDLFARIAKRTKTDVDDQILAAIKPPLGAALQLLNLYAALHLLDLPRHPRDYQGMVSSAARVAAMLIVAWAAVRAIGIVTGFLARLTAKTRSPLDDRLVPFIDRTLRAVMIIVAVLMVLQETGVNITSILTGLGLGGLAIALAAKDMLSNIFGTVTLVADHTFNVGDWIKTSAVEGTVEDIGLRSTKVRTFANSLVVVPNGNLAGGAVENFSRMLKRRISFRVGVTYETTPAQMREAVARIRDILRSREDIRQDFWLVYFSDFADSSMEIMVYCFTVTTVWGEFLAVREQLNLAILETLSEIGVELAFPSRAIYMREDDADERTRQSDRCAAMLMERSRMAALGVVAEGEQEGARSAEVLARGEADGK
ncbi:MAG: mechanosensitive ion channel family protein [Polyangia bacterium]|jgi:MscS family membrane protein|nr:mechanosensitive ion channel family protein [Polyangia bacterium]